MTGSDSERAGEDLPSPSGVTFPVQICPLSSPCMRMNSRLLGTARLLWLWVCGVMDVWSCGRVTYGHVKLRACGIVGVWSYGRVELWTSRDLKGGQLQTFYGLSDYGLQFVSARRETLELLMRSHAHTLTRTHAHTPTCSHTHNCHTLTRLHISCLPAHPLACTCPQVPTPLSITPPLHNTPTQCAQLHQLPNSTTPCSTRPRVKICSIIVLCSTNETMINI